MLLGLAAWLLAAPTWAAGATQGTRRALVICGLPGDDEHRSLYGGAVEKIVQALTNHYGFAKSEVFVRFGDEPRQDDGPVVKGSRGVSNREGIESDVAEMRRRLGSEDALWVIVVGHGHYDGRHSHLNIPGPDLDEREFAKVFEGIKAREQVFFLTTSASGFFLKPLAAPGRIVVTATEPDLEVNETVFPLALADTLTTPPDDADRDKDGTLSLLELYLAVVTDVMKRYAADENLPTEHARIDDNGDGHGSELQTDYLPPELGGPDPTQARKRPARSKPGPRDDGALASRTAVGPAPAGPAAKAEDDPRAEK